MVKHVRSLARPLSCCRRRRASASSATECSYAVGVSALLSEGPDGEHSPAHPVTCMTKPSVEGTKG